MGTVVLCSRQNILTFVRILMKTKKKKKMPVFTAKKFTV